MAEGLARVGSDGRGDGGVLSRPRQFQGRQRHARPSDRRQAARHHRGARARRGRARTTPSRGSAATSSRCCNAARAPKPRARWRGRLVEIISEPIEIDGQEINSGVSIGIALAPNDGTAADHLMKCADLALYRAKAEGRGTFRFFEPDMDARIQRAPRARSRSAPRADRRRVLARLSAADQSRQQRADRHGGAAALDPCGARAGAAVRVHPAGRGNGADRSARRMGAARSLQGSGALARIRSRSRSTSRRCSSAIAGWSRR